MVVGFSEVLDWFSKLGGFAGLWAAWRIYRDGIPQVRSELRPKLYSKTHPDQMDLILRFYPGSRPVTIHSIELPEFDISIVTPRLAGFPMRPLAGACCGSFVVFPLVRCDGVLDRLRKIGPSGDFVVAVKLEDPNVTIGRVLQIPNVVGF